VRRSSQAGRLDVLPSHYSRLPVHVPADGVLLQLSADRDGAGMSLGLANDTVSAAATRARLVIAEINQHVPWTFGGEIPADPRIDLFVESLKAPIELKPGRGCESFLEDVLNGAFDGLSYRRIRGHRADADVRHVARGYGRDGFAARSSGCQRPRHSAPGPLRTAQSRPKISERRSQNA
jgi:hypothetical protein